MNTKTYRTIVFLIIIAVIFSTSGLASAQPPQRLTTSSVQAITETDTTLDLCMYNEPSTMYKYEEAACLSQYSTLCNIYCNATQIRKHNFLPQPENSRIKSRLYNAGLL